MTPLDPTRTPALPPSAGRPEQRARTPAEAARQFEEVLVRQFVQTMTSGLFQAKLSGEEGPAWMGSYADMQRDELTNTLTRHLIDSGSLRLERLLMRQWGLDDPGATPDGVPAPEAPRPDDAKNLQRD